MHIKTIYPVEKKFGERVGENQKKISFMRYTIKLAGIFKVLSTREEVYHYMVDIFEQFLIS